MNFHLSFPTFVKDEFEAKLEKLNQKISKKNPDTKISVVNEKLSVKNVNTDLGPMDIVFSDVIIKVTGEAKIPGYHIKAIVDIRDGVRFARTFDQDFNVEEAQTDRCDHCNTKRARKQVYILQGEDGLKTVGSTCMHDFTGIDVASQLRPVFKFLDEEKKSVTHFKVGNTMVSTHKMVSAILKAYEEDSTFYKGTTALMVQRIMYTDQRDNLPLHDKTQETLDRLFYNNCGIDPNRSTYDHNIFHALYYTKEDGGKLTRDLFSRKSMGVISYLVYKMLEFKVPQGKTVAVKKGNGYVGKMDETITVTGKVDLAKQFTNKFGKSMIISILDEHNNIVKCFSSSKEAFNIKPDTTITMTGIVSKHETFRGYKNTMLKRCKFSV